MKALRIGSLVIGAIALAATGVGLAGSAGLLGATAGANGAATATGAALKVIATVGKVASFAAAASGLAASLLAHKSSSVSPFAWKADPQAGIPYAIGQCYLGGNIVYREAYGDKNKYQTIVTVLSGAGPHQSVDTLYVDNIARGIDPGGAVDVPDKNYMYAATQLGATPEAAELNVAPINPFEWTAACKLSGYAAAIVTLKFDTSGEHTMETTPQLGWLGKWAKVYDPRKDSTYPGGNGTHRWADPADTAGHDAARLTWEWSANPYLHALHWALGRWERDPETAGSIYVKTLGAGVPIGDILVSQYVEGANVADANGWTAHGSWSSTDDPWDVLKNILQAGGGVPMQLGAKLGCVVSTPRVPLATITSDDLAGDYSVQTMVARKDRINAVVPRYVGLQSVTTQDTDDNLVTSDTWSVVSAAPIQIADYVAADGELRQREITYSLVQGDGNSGNAPNQVAQLARYDIENAREFGPISLELKLRWYGYRPGDVVTVDIPELGLNGQDILILTRTLNPATGTVSITARSETAAKHAFALGQTTAAPATPTTSPASYVNPLASLYQTQLAALINGSKPSSDMAITAALDAGGTKVTVSIIAHSRIYADETVTVAAGTVTGLAPSTYYAIFYDDPDREGGAVTYQASTDPDDAVITSTNPGRTYVGNITTPATGSTSGSTGSGASGAGGVGAGYTGGACPEMSEPILLANAGRAGPGETIPAGEIEPGRDWVWTRHEHSGEWGAYPVVAKRLFPSTIWTAPNRPRCSPSHQFIRDDLSIYTMAEVGRPDGHGTVVALTVADAHSYVLIGPAGEQWISHNKTTQPD